MGRRVLEAEDMKAARERRFWKALGKRIKKAREDMWETQESLAGKLGLARTSVTNIEAGRQVITAWQLHEIACYLMVKPSTLIGTKF